MGIINMLVNTPVIYGVLGGFWLGAQVMYIIFSHQIRKAIKAREAKVARRKAAQKRMKQEQKFCHDWAETMELGAKNWGMQ